MLFHEEERIRSVAEALAPRIGGRVEGAAILGSGFSALAELLEERRSIPFTEVEGLPVCRALGHRGELLAGHIGGRRWVLYSGRLHLYEGHAPGEVAVPVALARWLGADRIVLTCAAGATSEALAPGSVVIVEDHINLTGQNPLLAVPVEDRHPPFLPMENAYDPAFALLAERLALGLPGGAARGVLAALPGPSYETPAEYRALARLGADVVSMSCAMEALAARALALRVGAIAIVANGPARSGQLGTDGQQVLERVREAVSTRLGFFRDLLAGFLAI